MKNWIISDTANIELNTDSCVSEVVAKLLAARGLKNKEDIKRFMNPSYEDLHDPFLLIDMDKAVDRIVMAIAKEEKVLIYGDYDVDGTTSSSILYCFLKKLGINAEVFIPSRFEEGYGLSMAAVDKIKDGGYNLIITVDCGIASVDEVEAINNLGIDIIITDHHQCQERLPRAIAVVNPHREDCKYPFKELCGAGVAYKLVTALSEILKIKGAEKEYIDIVALGTVADIVNLSDENRVFVYYGLKKINSSPCAGISSLIEVAGLKGKDITSYSVAFGLAPRLNAAGRLGDATRAVRLLTADGEAEAKEFAMELNSENMLRQQTEGEIYKEVIEYIEKDYNFEKNRVIVASGVNWHHGVIGIVASKVVEKYYRPCILLCNENGELRGSGRSIEGFNIFNALTSCNSLLIKYGGHEMAAGLTINSDNLDNFVSQINSYADNELKSGDLIERLHVDEVISAADVSMELALELKRLEPFGQGNPSPLFILRDIKINSIRKIGDGKHLKAVFSSEGKLIEAVAFNKGDLCDEFNPEDIVDVVCSIDINSYNNTEKVQLIVRDMRLCQSELIVRGFYNTIDKTIMYDRHELTDVKVELNKCEQISGDFPEEMLNQFLSNNEKCVFLVNDIDSVKKAEQLLETMKSKAAFRIDIGDFVEERDKNLYIIVNPSVKTAKLLNGSNVFVYGRWLDQIYLCAVLNCIDKGKLFLYNNVLGVSVLNGTGFDRDDVMTVYKYLWKTPEKTILLNDINKNVAEINLSYNRLINVFIFRKCIEVLNELRLINAEFTDNIRIKIEKFDNRGKKVQLEDSIIYRKLQGMLN